VKQVKRHIEHESSKLNEMVIQVVKRASESTKKEVEGVKKFTASGIEEVRKDNAALRE
jgi:hypothetical protein